MTFFEFLSFVSFCIGLGAGIGWIIVHVRNYFRIKREEKEKEREEKESDKRWMEQEEYRKNWNAQ